MNKTVVKVLLVITAIIIVIGLMLGYTLKKQVDSHTSSGSYMIDETNMSFLPKITNGFAYVIFGAYILLFISVPIGIMWLIYGIIFLINIIIKKTQNKDKKDNEEIIEKE